MGSGRLPCWGRGRRRGTGGTRGSGLRSPRISLFLCRNIVQFFAAQLPVVAEPIIEVPKIFLDRTPQRSGEHLRQPQMVEQLVHVPTVVSYSSLQQLTAEQIVDIPVPGGDGGGGRGGLQGSLPRQNSAALHVEQTADIPVPGSGGLHGFPGQGSTASSSHVGAADGAGQGFFRTFPQVKKSAKRGPHSGSELSADFNPSTLSVKFQQLPINSGWCLFSSLRGWCFLPLCSETGTHSVKLCFFGLVIDMPVVVHVKVVDILVMAQRLFPLVPYSRPLRFTSCSPLTWCSTSLLRRSSYFRVQAVRGWSRSYNCSR